MKLKEIEYPPQLNKTHMDSCFKARKEWWGTFYWMILNLQAKTIMVIGVSANEKRSKFCLTDTIAN
jgi:hypothetical protein